MEINGKYRTAELLPNPEERRRKNTKKGVRIEIQTDPQCKPVLSVCSRCGAEIRIGQLYYEMEGGKICPDCLPEYAQKFFLSHMRTCMPSGPEYDTSGIIGGI